MVKKRGLLFLLLLLFASLAYSQCTSTLGNPVVNEDFGSGAAKIGPPLAAGITNMTYTTGCPSDGQYTITNSSSGCYTTTWHSITDHTGNTNGYFMLINASYAPSDFFVQTVNGLCAGTSYQFSAWVLNMVDVGGQIAPNVTFTIEKTDGTILGTYTSGDIPVTNPYKWQQYGFVFKTPVGVSTVVIRMHNNAPGGVGNDIALDDITFTPVGPSINIAVNGTGATTVNAVCNKSVSLSASIGTCYVDNAYQWQFSPDKITWTDIPGATNPVFNFSISTSGSYYYRLGVAETGNIGSVSCRTNSAVITVNYTGAPTAASVAASICTGSVYTGPSGKVFNKTGIYVDTLKAQYGCDSIYTTINLTVKPRSFSTLSVSICKGDSYRGYTQAGTYIDTLLAANGCDSVRTINLTILPYANLGPDKVLCAGDSLILNPGVFTSYLWQDNSTKPTFKVTRAGIYSVLVANSSGCISADTITVKLINCSLPNIPNTFTPNGDGINDTWNISDLQYFPQCVVNIYSRWGAHLFNSIGYPVPWDGRYNGKPLPVGTYYYVIDLHNNMLPVSGWVTIIR